MGPARTWSAGSAARERNAAATRGARAANAVRRRVAAKSGQASIFAHLAFSLAILIISQAGNRDIGRFGLRPENHRKGSHVMAIPDRTTFESAYAGQAPWDIGKPQQAFID